MQGIDGLNAVYEDPYVFAREEKAKGRKVIGLSAMHFPEELVHASGALPVIVQESTEQITTGLAFIFPNFCAYTRSNVDMASRGQLDVLDAVVISDICLQTRMGFGVMARRMASVPFFHMWWPLEYNAEHWLPLVRPRLARVKSQLEEVVGRKITDQDLWKSIGVYNENRRLLREVYRLRGVKPGVLSAREMQTLVVGGMVMPKEEHSALLKQVLAHLEQARAAADGRVRIFLSGHMCHRVKPEILDMIEEHGGVVVGDDLYPGYRYYAAEVPEKGDVTDALAMRYFSLGVPCPTRGGQEGDWGDYLVSRSRESGAEVVLSLLPRFCEPHMFYYPHLKNRLLEAGMPFAFVETEHEMYSMEGVRTRIEALMETAKGGVR